VQVGKSQGPPRNGTARPRDTQLPAQPSGRHPIYNMVTRHLLLFEGVLNLLAGVFEVGLGLVALALIFSALVAGELADRFLGLTAKLF
jgi:hypothetical protein